MTGAGRHHKPEQRQAAVLLPAPEMALETKKYLTTKKKPPTPQTPMASREVMAW
jgi:hypothetical protein